MARQTLVAAGIMPRLLPRYAAVIHAERFIGAVHSHQRRVVLRIVPTIRKPIDAAVVADEETCLNATTRGRISFHEFQFKMFDEDRAGRKFPAPIRLWLNLRSGVANGEPA